MTSKYIYFLGCLLAFTTLCCKKDAVRPGFDMLYRKDFEIQAGISPLLVHHFYINNISSSYVASLASQQLTDAQIKQIINVNGELSSIFGDEKLDFISRISVRVFKEGEPTNYTEIAYRDPAPTNTTTVLGLIPSLANVKDKFQEDRFGLDIAIETRYITTITIPVRLDLKMRAEL